MTTPYEVPELAPSTRSVLYTSLFDALLKITDTNNVLRDQYRGMHQIATFGCLVDHEEASYLEEQPVPEDLITVTDVVARLIHEVEANEKIQAALYKVQKAQMSNITDGIDALEPTFVHLDNTVTAMLGLMRQNGYAPLMHKSSAHTGLAEDAPDVHRAIDAAASSLNKIVHKADGLHTVMERMMGLTPLEDGDGA